LGARHLREDGLARRRLRRWQTAPDIVELDLDGNRPHKAADPAKDPHATYVSNIEQEWVRTVIQQLSHEFREIVILREYEELSYQEIATILKCPLGDSNVTPGKSTLQAPRLALSDSVGGAIGKESHNWCRGKRNMRFGTRRMNPHPPSSG
jgi:Sigma-70, region 4